MPQFLFKIEVETKKPWDIEIDGYNYSHTGMRIHLYRHDLGLLMGGFYLPMALFSTLSLISFAVNPEVVRMYLNTFDFQIHARKGITLPIDRLLSG